MGLAHEGPSLLTDALPVFSSHGNHITHACAMRNKAIFIFSSKVYGVAATQANVCEYTKRPNVGGKAMMKNLQNYGKVMFARFGNNELRGAKYFSGGGIKHLRSAITQCS